MPVPLKNGTLIVIRIRLVYVLHNVQNSFCLVEIIKFYFKLANVYGLFEFLSKLCNSFYLIHLFWFDTDCESRKLNSFFNNSPFRDGIQ
jgi:hypothetical protein